VKRVYSLLSGIAVTRQVVDRLQANAIDERRIHALASADLRLGELSEGRLAKRTDLLPALISGIMHGGTVGDFAHIVALAMPDTGLVLAGSLVFDSSLARSDIDGFLAKTIAGADAGENFLHLRERIEGGEVLLMVDVIDDRVDDVTRLLAFRRSAALVAVGDSRLAPHYPEIGRDGQRQKSHFAESARRVAKIANYQ